MKTSRLFNILMLLIERRSISSTELAQILEVSVRTIYRDIDTLSQAGIPLYTTTGKYGGIHLTDGYVVDKAMFSEKEQEEIITSLQSIKDIPGIDINNVRKKISSIFNKMATVQTEWLEIDFASTTPKGSNLFEVIKDAIQLKKVLWLCYINANGEMSERNVEPVKLVFKYMSWYLFAYCQKQKSYRWFRITRITNYKLLQRSFTENHNDIKLPEIENVTLQGKKEHIELLFSLEIAHFVYDSFDRKFIHREANSIRVSMDKAFDEWFFLALTCFGSHVTILEPPNLKKIIYERHKKAFEHYSKDMGAV